MQQAWEPQPGVTSTAWETLPPELSLGPPGLPRIPNHRELRWRRRGIGGVTAAPRTTDEEMGLGEGKGLAQGHRAPGWPGQDGCPALPTVLGVPWGLCTASVGGRHLPQALSPLHIHARTSLLYKDNTDARFWRGQWGEGRAPWTPEQDSPARPVQCLYVELDHGDTHSAEGL